MDYTQDSESGGDLNWPIYSKDGDLKYRVISERRPVRHFSRQAFGGGFTFGQEEDDVEQNYHRPVVLQSGMIHISLRQGPGHSRTGMSDKAFVYQKLPHPDSIRLLRIEPRNIERLIFRLETTRLGQLSHPYEAISYVWGKNSQVVEIFTTEGTLKVTKNLSDALHQLSLPDKPRYIWADAVCINQVDTEERGHQVRLMRAIYKRAQLVVIWLGKDEKKEASTAFSVACGIASGVNVNGQPVGEASFRTRDELFNGHQPLPSAGSQSWRAVASLFGNAWFWRVWCIQEVALAASAVVLLGNFEISWKWLGLAAARIRIHFHQVLWRYDMNGIFNAYLMYRISQGDVDLKPHRLSFLHLLAMTRQFEATDPRDRIYGLLGLDTTDSNPEDGYLFIEPDYSLSVEDVYRELAHKVLRSANSLRLLSSVQHGPDIVDNVISWIPQWDKVYTSTLAPFYINRIAPSPSSLPLEYRLVSRDVIHVKGIRVSMVHEVLPSALPRPGKGFLPSLNEEQQHKLLSLLQTPEGQMRFCLTATAGQSWYGEYITDRDRHLNDFAAFIRKHELDFASYFKDRAGGDSDSLGEAARSACIGRRLFFDAEGRLGLGPAAAKPGDWICVLFGEVVPFALRPRNGHFLLVGECYVYDYMEGQMEKLWREGKLIDEFFDLH